MVGLWLVTGSEAVKPCHEVGVVGTTVTSALLNHSKAAGVPRWLGQCTFTLLPPAPFSSSFSGFQTIRLLQPLAASQ